MLWLAGLMGMVAVGAAGVASLMDTDDDQTSDETGDAYGVGETDQPYATDTDLMDLIGTDGDDTLSGTEASENIAGLSGDDEIGGYDGDDLILGGTGQDALFGADGFDTLDGGAGHDTLHGGDGADILTGGADNDQAFGGNGDDVLLGQDGDDQLQGSAGDDLVQGEVGDDALQGGLGDDTLVGGVGADSIFGGWGDDYLDGRAIDGAQPDTDDADFLNGGGGDDVIIAGPEDIVTTGDGADSVVLGDWATPGTQVRVMDFDAEQDRLIMIWDGPSQSEPEIALHQQDQQSDTAHLVVNGQTVAVLHGGATLTNDAIALLTSEEAVQRGMVI